MDQQQKVTKSKYIKEKGIVVMKDNDEDNFNAANNSGLFAVALGLSNKEKHKWAAKYGYNKSTISFGNTKVGLIEAYNFSSLALITTVHAEKERKGTLVKFAKTIAKSVLSIATNITSGSEEEGDDNDQMDNASAIKINRIDMINSNRNMLQDTDNEEEAKDCMGNDLKGEFDKDSGRAQEQARILNDNLKEKLSKYSHWMFPPLSGPHARLYLPTYRGKLELLFPYA